MIAVLMFSVGWMVYMALTSSVPSVAPLAENTIVIDAGHGGMDGGAVSAAGVQEKDLNLAVARLLKEIAQADGMSVVMTREEDKSLHTTDSSKIRVQKRSDLEYRRKVLNETGAMAFVSIHMNKFEQKSSRGAQVFYASNDRSRLLAQCIQKSLVEGIGNNHRVEKSAPPDVYMFKSVSAAAVIVECGFLSNPEEAELLGREEYQKQLAHYIYEGIKAFVAQQMPQQQEAPAN